MLQLIVFSTFFWELFSLRLSKYVRSRLLECPSTHRHTFHVLRVDLRSKWWFNETNLGIINCLEAIAKDRGGSMTAIAIAWAITKGCRPTAGLANGLQLDDLEALTVALSDEDIKRLEKEYKPLGLTGI